MTEHHAVEYEITATAVSDAIRLHQAKLLVRYRIVMVALALVGVALAASVSDVVGLWIAGVGVGMLAMTSMPFLDRWANQRRGRGVIGGMCKIEADEQGLHYEHPLGSGVVAWSALTGVSANDKSIVFGRDRVMAAYVPTTAFASSADRDAFLAFVHARVVGTASQD